MTGIRIDPCDGTSFRVIAALYALAFRDPWPEPSVRELMATPGTWGLIASPPSDGADSIEPAGFLLARLILDEAEILSLGVDPMQQRQGIARALVTACIQRVADAGGTSIFLEVGTDNPNAQALYTDTGFVEVGRRKQYYRRADGTKVDALIMQKKV